MEAPVGTEVVDLKVVKAWWQEGILHALSVNVERTIRDYEKVMAFYARVAGEKGKFCLLSDSSNVPPLNKELRDFLHSELPKYVRAIAIISDTASGKMIANITLTAKENMFQTATFTTAVEARAWLKTFIHPSN